VRLGQLLTNLLENAIDHGRAGGVITVTTQGTNGTVRLSVSNEGEPVAAHAVRTIFDPLRHRTDAEPRRAGAGLGLGLFIARQIALAHGGTIAATPRCRRHDLYGVAAAHCAACLTRRRSAQVGTGCTKGRIQTAPIRGHDRAPRHKGDYRAEVK
jgi:signal transduction histidine kinase